MIRNTIKNHADFMASTTDPIAKSPYFLVRARPAKFPTDARYGLIVTKRTFKHAVDRNRAKRLLRDWIAYNENLMLPCFDYIFIARSAILTTTRDDGRASMSRALTHIKRTNAPSKK